MAVGSEAFVNERPEVTWLGAKELLSVCYDRSKCHEGAIQPANIAGRMIFEKDEPLKVLQRTQLGFG